MATDELSTAATAFVHNFLGRENFLHWTELKTTLEFASSADFAKFLLLLAEREISQAGKVESSSDENHLDDAIDLSGMTRKQTVKTEPVIDGMLPSPLNFDNTGSHMENSKSLGVYNSHGLPKQSLPLTVDNLQSDNSDVRHSHSKASYSNGFGLPKQSLPSTQENLQRDNATNLDAWHSHSKARYSNGFGLTLDPNHNISYSDNARNIPESDEKEQLPGFPCKRSHSSRKQTIPMKKICTKAKSVSNSGMIRKGDGIAVDSIPVSTAQHSKPSSSERNATSSRSNSILSGENDGKLTTTSSISLQLPAAPSVIFLCDICEAVFEEQSALAEHLRISHADAQATQDAQEYSCSECGISFPTSQSVTRHMKKHFKKTGKPLSFSCSYCSSKFDTLPQLTDHQKTHDRADDSLDKPFPCPSCGLRFSKRNTLNRHRLVHTGERPHICRVCNKAFTRKYLMKQHEAIIHNIPPSPSNRNSGSFDDIIFQGSPTMVNRPIHSMHDMLPSTLENGKGPE